VTIRKARATTGSGDVDSALQLPEIDWIYSPLRSDSDDSSISGASLSPYNDCIPVERLVKATHGTSKASAQETDAIEPRVPMRAAPLRGVTRLSLPTDSIDAAAALPPEDIKGREDKSRLAVMGGDESSFMTAWGSSG